MTCRMLIAALLIAGFYALPLQAAPADSPFNKGCSDHPSAKAFVHSASYYCVRQNDSKNCHKAAEAYFNLCGYEGDFQQLSRRAYTGMLFMFVVAKAPQVADTVPER